MTDYDFGWAYGKLKEGYRVRRYFWDNRHKFIELEEREAWSRINTPFLVVVDQNGDQSPWVPSMTDLFASDWEVFNED